MAGVVFDGACAMFDCAVTRSIAWSRAGRAGFRTNFAVDKQSLRNLKFRDRLAGRGIVNAADVVCREKPFLFQSGLEIFHDRIIAARRIGQLVDNEIRRKLDGARRVGNTRQDYAAVPAPVCGASADHAAVRAMCFVDGVTIADANPDVPHLTRARRIAQNERAGRTQRFLPRNACVVAPHILLPIAGIGIGRVDIAFRARGEQNSVGAIRAIRGILGAINSPCQLGSEYFGVCVRTSAHMPFRDRENGGTLRQ